MFRKGKTLSNARKRNTKAHRPPPATRTSTTTSSFSFTHCSKLICIPIILIQLLFIFHVNLYLAFQSQDQQPDVLSFFTLQADINEQTQAQTKEEELNKNSKSSDHVSSLFQPSSPIKDHNQISSSSNTILNDQKPICNCSTPTTPSAISHSGKPECSPTSYVYTTDNNHLLTRRFETFYEKSPHLFHPYPNLPAPNRHEELWLQKLRNSATQCSHDGKVFNLGMFKTGTKSMMFALEDLGYPCGGPWMNTCKFHKMHSHFKSSDIHEHMFLTLADDVFIDKLVEIDYLFDYFRIMTASQTSAQFGDGPWLFLYPWFDAWFPNEPSSLDDFKWHFASNYHARFNPYNVELTLDNNMNPPQFRNSKEKPKLTEQNFDLNLTMYTDKNTYDEDDDVASYEKKTSKNAAAAENPNNENEYDFSGNLDIVSIAKQSTEHFLKHGYTASNVKYVLTVRNSVWDIVNSDLKMYCRTLKLYDTTTRQHLACKDTDFYNTSEIDTKFDIWRTRFGTSFKDYMMLIARRYQLHNENVVQYFHSRGQMDKLLVVNLFDARVDHWEVLMKFLGCKAELRPDKPFPHSNKASKPSDAFIPRDYPLKWKYYRYKMWQPNFHRY